MLRGNNLTAAKLLLLGLLVSASPLLAQIDRTINKLADGVYEINFVPPQTGVYYLFFQCPSLGVQFNQLQHLNIEARD